MKETSYLKSMQLKKKTLNTLLITGILLSIKCQKTKPLPPPIEFIVIERDTTIGPDTVYFDKPVLVRDAKLTVEPGTFLYLGSHTYILVSDSGQLFAVGTESNPITITGDSLWQGITLIGSSGESILKNVKISGSSGLANITVMSRLKVSILNSTLSNAKNYGISFPVNGEPMVVDSCLFSENKEGDVFAYTLKPLLKFGKNNLFDTTHKTSIYINGDTEILTPGTLQLSGVGIKIDGNLSISADFYIYGPLKIFMSGEVSVHYAQLRAEGVEFRSLNEQWKGVTIENSELYLDSVTIAHAGLDNTAALVIKNTSTLLLRNLVVDSSSSNGVFLDSRIDTIYNFTVRKSNRYPLVITHPSYLPYFKDVNFINNGIQAVRLIGFQIDETLTWSDPGIPVSLNSLVIGGGNSPTLYLDTNMALRFPGNGYLRVGDLPGGLVANGVTFTGNDTSGWKGIHIGPDITEVQLLHCIIEYGGLSKEGVDSGNVTIHETTAPIIDNSVIQFSHTYGIYLYGSANTPEYRHTLETNNIFYDNALGNIGPP